MAATGKHWTEEEARLLMGELEASGLSVKAFAQHRGLSYERIRKWRGKFRREVARPSPRLVELVAPAPDIAAPLFEPMGQLVMRCPSGHSIVLPDMALAMGLNLLLAALDERAPC